MSVLLPAASTAIVSSSRSTCEIDLREAIERLREVGAEFPPTGCVDHEQSAIRVEIDELDRVRDRLMVEYYEARRNGTATMVEDEVRAEVDRLSAEFILTKAVEQVQE